MPIPQEELSRIVAQVLEKLGEKAGEISSSSDCGCKSATSACACEAPAPSSPIGRVVFPDVDSAVQAASRAQQAFQELGLEKRCRIISAMRKAALKNAERLAKLAVEETGMGRVEDKVQKNTICALKTPGVEDLKSESWTGDKA
jgi:propionaldehyde dehydrogenase